MSESKKTREFKVLSDIEHVLCRPGMYVGSVALTEKDQWIYSKEENRFHYGTAKYVPALLKCASELIDNSIDVAIDTDFAAATKIKVNVDDTSIEVIDNGIGIPCEPVEGSNDKSPEKTCACLAWTTLKSGTSFEDNRQKIGTNGVGSSCVNVFSKVFIGESDDGKHSQKIECRDNLSFIKAHKVKTTSGKPGCRVYCEPDLRRFGLEKIDQVHKDLIYQRLVNLSISYPKIKFVFNGEAIRINEKKFAQMFSDDAILASSNNTTVCVFPNEHDEFKFYACVNGLDTTRGGSHVDHISMEIANKVRERLARKYKSIRPGDVKNKICVAILLTEFKNPQFDSQTKESLANSNVDILKHIDGKIDFDSLARQIIKSESIVGPIIETFKIKEELKVRQELKKVKKIKVKSDKYKPAYNSQKYLFLCEGQSAQSSLSKCLGSDGNAFYACRGLAINVVENSMQKIAANQEFKDIMNILELDITKDTAEKTISFDKVVIACDQDLDGIHLSSMLIGWFKRFAPNLFKEGKVCKLQTPLIILKNSKGEIKDYFFDLDTFKQWEKTHPNSPFQIYYQKGLGSMCCEDIDWLISNRGGLDTFLYSFKCDKDAFANIDLWLSGDAEPRKEKLRNYTLDINLV